MGTTPSRVSSDELGPFPSSPPASTKSTITVFSDFKKPANTCTLPAEVLNLIFLFAASSSKSLSGLERTCQQFYKLLNHPASSSIDGWRLFQLKSQRTFIYKEGDVDLQTRPSNTTKEWKMAAKRAALFNKERKTPQLNTKDLRVAFGSSSKSINALDILMKFLKVHPSDYEKLGVDKELDFGPERYELFIRIANSDHVVKFTVHYLTSIEEYSVMNDQFLRDDMLILLYSINEPESIEKADSLLDKHYRIRDIDSGDEANVTMVGMVTDPKADKHEGHDFEFAKHTTLYSNPSEAVMEAWIVDALVDGFKKHLNGRRARPVAAK